MQSGAPVFGSPESQIALVVSAQLARLHGLPFRSGGMFTSSKIADAQAAYESVQVMLPTVLARVNFCLLYTSDAADERSSVDLGGRRIIKKNNK